MTSVGIIGSGFGALAVAVELTQAGYTDLRLWERADDLGGVWRDNTYPGAGCDVPSPLYSFSFAPNPFWSRRYALQEEIHAYLRDTAARFGITPRIQFGHDVVAARWTGEGWTVGFSDGSEQSVDVLVSAVGQLSRPRLPDLPGIESFEGEQFHSAQWRADFDARGKRVAIVGAGASAVQLIPRLARDAAALTVFQRTASYVIPRPDKAYAPWRRWLFTRFPLTLRAERDGIWAILEHFARAMGDTSRVGAVNRRLAGWHLRRQVADPVLRAKLTPDYPIGCRRILFSNDVYPALARPTVEVVTEHVTAVTADGVIDGAGTRHEVDAIIWATGFDAQEFLSSLEVVGTDGRKLAEQWTDGAHAYLGIYAPHFPNLFLSYGPNTNLGGSSVVYMLEAQARNMRKVLDEMTRGGFSTVEVTEHAEKAYDDEVQHLLAHSAWSHCDSWYRHPSGRITSNWPGATLQYSRRTQTVTTSAFQWS